MWICVCVFTTVYSSIYCRGELLNNVQMQRFYPDSKIFVDVTSYNILKAYRGLKLQNNGESLTHDQLSLFIG